MPGHFIHRSIDALFFALTIIVHGLAFDLMVHIIFWMHDDPHRDHLLQQLITYLQTLRHPLLVLIVAPLAALVTLGTVYLAGRFLHAAGISRQIYTPAVHTWVAGAQVLWIIGALGCAVVFSHVYLWQGSVGGWLAGCLYILALTVPLKLLLDAFKARPLRLKLSSRQQKTA